MSKSNSVPVGMILNPKPSTSGQPSVQNRPSTQQRNLNPVGSMEKILAEEATKHSEQETDGSSETEQLLRMELNIYKAKYQRSKEELAAYKNDTVLNRFTSDLTQAQKRNTLLQDEKLALIEKAKAQEDEQDVKQAQIDEKQSMLKRSLDEIASELTEKKKLVDERTATIEQLKLDLLEAHRRSSVEASIVETLKKEIAAARKTLAPIAGSDGNSESTLFDLCQNIEALVQAFIARVRTLEFERGQMEAAAQNLKEQSLDEISKQEEETRKLSSMAISASNSKGRPENMRHDSKTYSPVRTTSGETKSMAIPNNTIMRAADYTISTTSVINSDGAATTPIHPRFETPPKEGQPKPQVPPKQKPTLKTPSPRTGPQVVITSKTPNKAVVPRQSSIPRSINKISPVKSGSPNAFTLASKGRASPSSPHVKNTSVVDNTKAKSKMGSNDDEIGDVGVSDLRRARVRAAAEDSQRAPVAIMAALSSASQDTYRVPTAVMTRPSISSTQKAKQASSQRLPQPKTARPTSKVPRTLALQTSAEFFISDSADELSKPPTTKKRKSDENTVEGNGKKSKRSSNTDTSPNSISSTSSNKTTTPRQNKGKARAKSISPSRSGSVLFRSETRRGRRIVMDDDDEVEDGEDDDSEGSNIVVQPASFRLHAMLQNQKRAQEQKEGDIDSDEKI
jgi:hypothetical protein